MNKYKKLASNTGIFFIGNFGSKILSFLLVRFYTECLTTEQYGTIDVITSTLGFIVPIITLCITEAVLRFSIDDIKNRKRIFSIGSSIIVIGNILFLVSIPIFGGIDAYQGYLPYFYLLTLTNSFYQMTACYVKGCGNSKSFAFAGLLHTFIQLSLNILLLLVFKGGVGGYLLASITSNVVTIIYLVLRSRILSEIEFKIDKSYMFQMLRYSIPLIPNSIFWWIMQASDRYVILFFLGASFNGLYTVANKIPTIITSLSSIFFSAWQLSSVDEAQSEDKARFFSNTLMTVSLLLLIMMSFVLVVMQSLFKVWVAPSYYVAWQCTPLLLLATFFSCLSSYLGTNYVAMKKTKGVFITTVCGAVLNVILNILLTPVMGIKGTALATVVSFLVTWIIRAIDTRKFVEISYSIKTFFIPLCIVSVQTILLTAGIRNVTLQIILFLIMMIITLKELLIIIRKVHRVLFRK